jgi:hypothetical protein
MVERVGSTIVYKQNDVIFYTSLIPTDEALFVDCTIHTYDGEISDVKLTLPSEPDISYWVKIRHKREADLLSNEPWTDYATSTTNAIIYYGYATSTATTLEHFTTDETNPDTASPVDIITSYGSSGKSSDIIEIQARKLPGPPIIGGVYGNTISANGNITIDGDDDCASSDSVPAVAYVTDPDFQGSTSLDSAAGTSTQIPELDLATIVDQLESTATIILDDGDDPSINDTLGSISNYEIVFCDATQLSDSKLDFTNLTGHGTLVVRGDVDFGGNTTWNGIIIASENAEFSGTGFVYGSVLAKDITQSAGDLTIIYDSCDIENAKDSYRYSTFRWEDKKMN